MEGFLTIIGLIIAWNVLASFFSKDETSGGYSPSTPIATEKFKIKVSNDRITGDEFKWDVFKIQMKGAVDGPYANVPVKTIVQIFDTTDGSEEIVLCTYEDFQKGDSEVFWHESERWNLPYADTIFTEWSQVIQVPKMFLVLARKGSRKLKFKVSIVNTLNDNILSQSTSTVSYQNTDAGYKDAIEHREYFEEMVIKSAMLVSASDGEMDTSEAKIVTNWIQKRISRYTESSQSEHKARLNAYVKDVYSEIKNESIDIYDVLDGIDNIASEGDKFELFQLCLDVAKADGEADKKELEMVHDIADYINLDEKQFRSMIEKTLPIQMHTGKQTPETILGITSNMSDSEIKKHLMTEYRKWNQRVANSDPEIRKQAEDMIQIIANLRKKYN